MALLASAKAWARTIKRDVVAVYFAARHPDTPLLVRLLALAVAAYALSPIDLIPDVIPVLGYLDDLLIVPIGLVIVLRLLPPHVLASSRAQAAEALKRPRSIIAAVFVVAIWLACTGAFVYWLARA
ncbi:MAG: hypothetical protein C0487_05705 [Leptothrix sp. (in: Bacteria)]|nr:hypothetical protein [Leptothrix sp. (in: b-proteobacteria)]